MTARRNDKTNRMVMCCLCCCIGTGGDSCA